MLVSETLFDIFNTFDIAFDIVGANSLLVSETLSEDKSDSWECSLLRLVPHMFSHVSNKQTNEGTNQTSNQSNIHEW